jgi:hypothetical protein
VAEADYAPSLELQEISVEEFLSIALSVMFH